MDLNNVDAIKPQMSFTIYILRWSSTQPKFLKSLAAVSYIVLVPDHEKRNHDVVVERRTINLG
jgi:hypothetical protein